MNGFNIDKVNFSKAVMACDFLSQQFLPSGRYEVDERWGPEGLLYLAESSYALMSMYSITHNKSYLNAVRSILIALQKAQKPSGGWALELSSSGIGFAVTKEIIKITAEIEDLPPTVATLKTISDYYTLSKDDSFNNMGHNAFNYLMEYWNPAYGSFLEKENNALTALRSNPRSYHLFSYLGIQAWRIFEPKIVDEILPSLLQFIKNTFESYDKETMPLVYGLHSAVLCQNTPIEYIQKIIKPKIEIELIDNPTFAIESLKGAYGHRDGLRGIVKTEAHMRSAAGIAIASKFYDSFSKESYFTNTSSYLNVSNWILEMASTDFFYEFEILPERKKMGKGSPGQYLPIWWIIGKI
jgi:hypothetical protein